MDTERAISQHRVGEAEGILMRHIRLNTMTKAVDPVCGMEVDTERAVHKAVYKGKVYYFCSSHCKRAFERDPEKYLKLGPQGMPEL